MLAGGPADTVARTDPAAPNKAFIKIGGIALVTRTLLALRAANHIEKIIVVAPPKTHTYPALNLADEFRADGELIGNSLESGLRGLEPDANVLVAPSDLPILSAEAIDEYVVRATQLDVEVTYGCLERRTHDAVFPEVPHTWARLRDGTFCGAGFATLRPRSYPLLAKFIERLGAARKNPFALASLFGWHVLLRFALRRLSIQDAEIRASTLLGAPVRAVITSHPEMAINVDRVSDISLAQDLLGRR